MRYNPHEYQCYAAAYIETHPIAAIFLNMGLGKTSITLTGLNDLLFDCFEIHKILVIAPLRVARDTWSAEIGEWEHLSSLPVLPCEDSCGAWRPMGKKKQPLF